MTFPSRELVVLAGQLPVVTIDPVTRLRMSIKRALGNLTTAPKQWIEFDAYRVPDEQLALICGELVVQGWEAKIRKQRFAPFHSYSGFPKPKFIQVRGG